MPIAAVVLASEPPPRSGRLAVAEARGLRARRVLAVERDVRVGALERQPRRAAGHLDAWCQARSPRRRARPRRARANVASPSATVSKRRSTQRLGALGHRVLDLAAADLPDVDGDAARVVGEPLRAVDEARERPDRVRALLVRVARVRGLAVATTFIAPAPLRA